LLWFALAETALMVPGENLLSLCKLSTFLPIFDVPSSVLFILFVVNYHFGNVPLKQTSLIQKCVGSGQQKKKDV
jgi:hypothetical protein